MKDFDDGVLNLDAVQSKQARNSCTSAAEAVNRTVRETYKWLLAPTEEAEGKGITAMRWEHFVLNTGASSFVKEIERVMTEHELVIERWAPVHLDSLLKAWYWKDGAKDVSAQDVWQKSCMSLYMPRLKDSFVVAATVCEGTDNRDFFGLSQGKREDKYLGFTFGQPAMVHLESNLLIEPTAAAEYEAAARAAEEASRKIEQPDKQNATVLPTAGSPRPTVPASKSVNRLFYGAVDLDPLMAKKQFADIVDEVVQQFTTRPNDRVRIVVEIQAESSAGFDDGVQRAVRENCSALKFKSSGFEAGE